MELSHSAAIPPQNLEFVIAQIGEDFRRARGLLRGLPVL
jgi:hypothetical protein